jgi:hypothetical protein
MGRSRPCSAGRQLLRAAKNGDSFFSAQTTQIFMVYTDFGYSSGV